MSDTNKDHSIFCAILGAISGVAIALLVMKNFPKIKSNMKSKMEM